MVTLKYDTDCSTKVWNRQENSNVISKYLFRKTIVIQYLLKDVIEYIWNHYTVPIESLHYTTKSHMQLKASTAEYSIIDSISFKF